MAFGGPGGSSAYPGRHEKVASAPGRYSGSVNSDPGRNRGYGPVNEVHVPMLSDARVNE